MVSAVGTHHSFFFNSTRSFWNLAGRDLFKKKKWFCGPVLLFLWFLVLLTLLLTGYGWTQRVHTIVYTWVSSTKNLPSGWLSCHSSLGNLVLKKTHYLTKAKCSLGPIPFGWVLDELNNSYPAFTSVFFTCISSKLILKRYFLPSAICNWATRAPELDLCRNTSGSSE